MLQSYDEDLLENVFYIGLQSKAPDIFHRATTERWMISIPKIGTIPKSAFTEENFKTHILQAIDDRPNSYRTLNEKEVLIQDNAITTGSGFKDIRTVNILFEETFYNKSDESYRVLCINSPLEGGKFEGADAVPVISLQTIEDCTDLLWGHTASRKTKRQLDDLVEFFNESYNRLEGESLRHNMDAAHSVFTRAMQIVLKDNYLKRTSRHSKPYMDSLKTAVETYVMHGIYKKLFKSVRACLAANDSQLNKITRNLSELQLRDLGVRSEFCHNVPKARRELSSINKYTTPLGKLYCVRRAVQAIMQPPKILKKGVEAVPITTDDLLPILIFVVVKSETPNWRANLTFMTNFRFSKSSNDDEFGFYLASLEAVIEHVNSGQLNNIQIGAANPQKLQLSTSPPSSSPGGLWRQDSGGGADTQALDILFQLVKDGKFKQVSDVLSKHQKNIDDTALKLCHPLCSCDKCEALLSRSRSDSSTVTVFSRDDRGYTALHMASANGQSECLSVLIKKGAVVNAADYHGSTPLHLACQRGHKTVALLLLHYKCDLNACDNDGSSPLHLCTANGHEECVRALVEHDQGSGTPIDINASNDAGDTALHLASKWGYESILELLLEHGASVEARNRRKQTPVTCAHNANVQRLLQRASVKIDERRFSFSNVQIEVGTSPSLSIDMMPSPKDRAESSLSNVSIQSYPSTGSEPRETSFGRKEEILLKSVADGDIEMVKYHLGWDIDSDIEDSDDECFDATRELCHPLCQCPKCIPLQKAFD
ncbi:unnamed protein product [Owenia fusiformis]|uniref:VPS9 domain-containing protein n=1 Tax=Owenia fusiformis TaxID=6347 RepID=A0A8S4NEL3_OWEFU|nr:unnamed protein product [Owenia fusiformis]